MSVYDEYQPPASDGGLFHKFVDGETYRFRLASEPVVFESVFNPGKENETVSTKYAWLAWDVDNKAAKILQLPVTGYKQVAALAVDADWGDPAAENGYGLTMKRTGTGLETEYTITPSPKRMKLDEYDPAAPEAISKLDIKEILGKNENNHNVFFLSEAVKQPKKALSQTKVLDEVKKSDDVVIEDIDDKPIDLSEIPF